MGGWIYGPYVNHNHYAGLMEMLVPIPLVLSLTEAGFYQGSQYGCRCGCRNGGHYFSIRSRAVAWWPLSPSF